MAKYNVVGIDTGAEDINLLITPDIDKRLRDSPVARVLKRGNTVLNDKEAEILLSFFDPKKIKTGLGGATSNTVKNITPYLGNHLVKTHLMASVGDDMTGERVKGMLKENEVNLIGPTLEGSTKTVFCLIDDISRQQRYAELKGVSGDLDESYVGYNQGLISDADILYTTCYSIASDNKLRRSVRKAFGLPSKRKFTAFNLANVEVLDELRKEDNSILTEMIDNSNVVIGNVNESMMLLCGERDVFSTSKRDVAEELSKEILKKHKSLDYAIITLGAEGSVVNERKRRKFWFNRNEIHHVHAYKVEEVINPVGAGDSFAGVSLCQMLAGTKTFDAFNMASQEATKIIKANVTGIGEVRRREQADARLMREKEEELNAARETQMAALKDEEVTIGKIKISKFLEPSLELSGDFYDYNTFANKPTRFDFMIGDICGKGAKAALKMVTVLNTERAISQNYEDVGELVTELNKRLCNSRMFNDLEFVTALYASIDTEKEVMNFVNAGHGFLILRDGKILTEEYFTKEKTNQFAFIMDGIVKYNTLTAKLEKGDRIILYTDGITEAGDEQDFGMERLEKTILENHANSGEKLINNIINRVKEYTGKDKQRDDMTLFVADYET